MWVYLFAVTTIEHNTLSNSLFTENHYLQDHLCLFSYSVKEKLFKVEKS